MSIDAENREPLIEVGRYARLADARERGLVIAARDLPHWIEREQEEWSLRVEERSREVALREIAAFESERREQPSPAATLLPDKIPTFSLYVAAWVLGMFFFLQNVMGRPWMDRGAARSVAILHDGEWWRVITALTLHADLPHVVANLITGLLFAAFVIPRFGAGLAWLGIVSSGALGNAINAWGYRAEAHGSIGASTAVFGALGILVGAEWVGRWSSPQTRSRWQLVLPIGAGLALLAFLGVGEARDNIDYMAHGWGFVAGILLGAAAEALRFKERAPAAVQRAAAVLALLLPVFAWMRAWDLFRR